MVSWKIFREHAAEVLPEKVLKKIDLLFEKSDDNEVPAKLGDALLKKKLIDRGARDLLNEAYELLKIEENARTIPGNAAHPLEIAIQENLPQLKKFKIIDAIGEGGMGRVYKGIDPDLGRPVAIKEISAEEAQEWQKQRFQREIKLTARLDQEHRVIRARAVDTDEEGNTYFVMDYVEGKEYTEYVNHAGRGIKYSMENVIEHLVEALDAISTVHAEGIIHRDIKPDNIMVDRKNIKIMDFGLAKEIGDEEIEADTTELDSTEIGRTGTFPNLTLDGIAMGTPNYMSPEQAIDSKNVDERTDIYSFGAILYEILTGQSPNITNIKRKRKEKIDIRAILVNLANENNLVLPPSKINKEVPPELESICMKALETKPSKRYQTAEAFKKDLKAYLEGNRVEAHKYSIFSKISRFVQRHTAAAVSAFLLVSALGIGGVVYQGLQAGKARAEARAEKEAKEKLRLETDLAQEIAEKERQKRKKALTEKLLAEEKAEREKERADQQAMIASKNHELAEKYLATKAIERARIFRKQGDIPAAITLLENWKDRVDIAILHSDLGAIYSEQNNLENAEKEYLKAIELDPSFAAAYINLGILAKKREHYADAEKYITKAIKINPNFAEAYNRRASIYMSRQQYEDAIKDIEKAIDLSPENADYVYNKGGIYFLQNRYHPALTEFKKALSLGDTRAYFFIAEIYKERGEMETAKRFYEECVRSDNSPRRKMAVSILEEIAQKE